jgi:hypothetical protein
MFRPIYKTLSGQPQTNTYTGNQYSIALLSEEKVWDFFTTILLYWNSSFCNEIFWKFFRILSHCIFFIKFFHGNLIFPFYLHCVQWATSKQETNYVTEISSSSKSLHITVLENIFRLVINLKLEWDNKQNYSCKLLEPPYHVSNVSTWPISITKFCVSVF